MAVKYDKRTCVIYASSDFEQVPTKGLRARGL